MMVSKIAVIALVAIVASPILIGYAMNLQSVTETDYKATDDSVNVSQMLLTGTAYSYAHADVYEINSRLFLEGGVPGSPYYHTLTTNKTSKPMSGAAYTNSVPTGTLVMSDYKYFFFMADVNVMAGFIRMNVNYSGGTSNYFDNIHSVYYDVDTSTLYYNIYYLSGGQVMVSNYYDLSNVVSIQFSSSGGYVGRGMLYYIVNDTNTYVNMSAGFYLNYYCRLHASGGDSSIVLPTDPNSVMFSMDLGSISDASYYFEMNIANRIFGFQKITDAEGEHWNVSWDWPGNELNLRYDLTELYYDSSRSENTYQIQYTRNGIDFNYVGDWPTLFGSANTYWNYHHDYDGGAVDIPSLSFSHNVTPRMRMEDAEYKAFTYNVIEDVTYSPGAFKSNPQTTIKDITLYGTSIEFGGNTYTVSDGKIRIGTHDVPVNGLVFSSVPSNGQYENKIGNTVISTSIKPSTIALNGQWSANVSTAAMELTSYTKTEWTAGSFGWDGMDQNFLMVGLFTCLGVFIALGIYARKSRSGGIIPLMIVTGCAAMIFFILL